MYLLIYICSKNAYAAPYDKAAEIHETLIKDES